MNGLFGLLGTDEELTPEQQARNNALLMAGLQGLMASGPSLTPTSFGQIFSQAAMTGLGSYQEGLQQAQSQQMAREMQQTLQGTGGAQGDPSSVANRYRQLAVQLSANDPQKANLYLQMADKLEGDRERFTGTLANASLELFGTADIGKLSENQRREAANYARQQDLARASAGAARVNFSPGVQVGSIPPGFFLKTNPDGTLQMAPVPGSPADIQARQEQEQAGMRKEQKGVTGGIVLQEIGRALDIAQGGGMFTVGRGAVVGQIDPESQASTLVNLNNTIKANIGFDKIQNMRESSPTGGALGNVTEREIDFLQATAGALEPKGDPVVYQDNLKRLHNIYMDAIHGTPAQIDEALIQGKITPQQAQQLKFRYPLTFEQPKQRRPLDEILGQ